MPSSWVMGAAPSTCGFSRTRSATACQSSSGCSVASTACGTMPRIRPLISRWKPFITDSTMIIASTPSDRPIIEVSEMKEMKWLRRLARV